MANKTDKIIACIFTIVIVIPIVHHFAEHWPSEKDCKKTDYPQIKAIEQEANAKKAGIQWVPLPGGSYEWGKYNKYVKPQDVTIRPFKMMKTEVTSKQYALCLDAGYCTLWRERATSEEPEYATWLSANFFCHWIGGRLPSETEWEYAARNNGTTKYPWGNNEIDFEDVENSNQLQPVCSNEKDITKNGICDMAANEREWVLDWFYFEDEPVKEDGSPNNCPPPVDIPLWNFFNMKASDTKQRVVRGLNYYSLGDLDYFNQRWSVRHKFVSSFRCLQTYHNRK